MKNCKARYGPWLSMVGGVLTIPFSITLIHIHTHLYIFWDGPPESSFSSHILPILANEGGFFSLFFGALVLASGFYAYKKSHVIVCGLASLVFSGLNAVTGMNTYSLIGDSSMRIDQIFLEILSPFFLLGIVAGLVGGILILAIQINALAHSRKRHSSTQPSEAILSK